MIGISQEHLYWSSTLLFSEFVRHSENRTNRQTQREIKRELINLIGITLALLVKIKGFFVLVEVIQRWKTPPIDYQLSYGFSLTQTRDGWSFLLHSS